MKAVRVALNQINDRVSAGFAVLCRAGPTTTLPFLSTLPFLPVSGKRVTRVQCGEDQPGPGFVVNFVLVDQMGVITVVVWVAVEKSTLKKITSTCSF